MRGMLDLLHRVAEDQEFPVEILCITYYTVYTVGL